MRVLVNDVPNKPHAHAGQVLDLPDAEAKDMISRGTATAAPEEPPAELPGQTTLEPEPEPVAESKADEPAPPTKPARPRPTKSVPSRLGHAK